MRKFSFDCVAPERIIKQNIGMELAYDLYLPYDSAQWNDTPVVMLHAAFDSKLTWKKIAPQIANSTGRKVYALDMRNHGDSAWSNEMVENDFCEDLDKFLRDQNIPRAAFIGHSLGATVIMYYALQKPENVEKLVVEDAVVNYGLKERKSTNLIFQLLKASFSAIPPEADDMTARKAIVDYMKTYLSPTEKSSRGLFIFLEGVPLINNGYKYTLKTNMDTVLNVIGSSKEKFYPSVYNGEALFLSGKHSFLQVENDKMVRKYFPRAATVVFEEAGHFLHHEYPEEFLREVIKFLSL